MKKITSMALALVLLTGVFNLSAVAADKKVTFSGTRSINVVSREEGSGTRGAFVELFEVQKTNAAGKKIDITTDEAVITNSTSVMMTNVSNDVYAIGYISLGSLNKTVKALSIDGVAASVDNIKNGKYKISRPFNVATKGTVSAAAGDFLAYILSADGQKVIENNGYIAVSKKPAYKSSGLQGKVVVAGSSSVTPVMEKLKEAYVKLNPKVTVEIQMSDSSIGMTSTIDGICDIGMASRALKDSELEKGLTPTVIAMDGIAVIVSNDNPTANLSKEKVRDIFTGKIGSWTGATK